MDSFQTVACACFFLANKFEDSGNPIPVLALSKLAVQIVQSMPELKSMDMDPRIVPRFPAELFSVVSFKILLALEAHCCISSAEICSSNARSRPFVDETLKFYFLQENIIDKEDALLRLLIQHLQIEIPYDKVKDCIVQMTVENKDSPVILKNITRTAFCCIEQRYILM